jgi:Tfp pilus assembly protein PilN
VSQVNLLPPELLARQKQRRLTSLIILGGAIGMLLLLGFWFLQGQKLSDVNEQIAAQNAVNAGLQAQIADLSEFQALQEEAAQKEALLATAYAGEVSFSGILMDMSRVIPSDAYLTAMNILLTETAATAGGAVPPAGAAAPGSLIGTISADGQAAGVESLASWLTRLESVQGWVNPWLTSIQETEAGSRLYTYASGVDLSSDALTARGKAGLSSGG